MPAENITPEKLERELPACMQRDRHGLMRRLRKAQADAAKGKLSAAVLTNLGESVNASKSKVENRRRQKPHIKYPEMLPVVEKREEIAQAISNHQVVIICGETGSGKTTQLPKICLDVGRGIYGLIGHTQPRRIAARSVAQRIAEELQTPFGHHVGYKVRFSDHVSEHTYIKLMTDGILLAETQNDKFLDAYDTIIIDEAHERSLNIDFLVGYLKRLLPRRPDLKVIITSATIDPERFSRHFDNAPIIEVSGRTYPVEIRYQPVQGEDEDERDRDITQAIIDAVDDLARMGPGDVLVFLPGERDIRETAEALRKHHPPQTEILPLFARLSVSEQEKIFKPHKGRRIVLSTNVAETSLTVPGIRYVVDTGQARISRYSYRTKVQRLPIEAVSQASANQRAGRCGRVSAGVCIRLYSEEDYQGRATFTDPEILRTNLASVILQMKALRLGDIEDFPFVEKPDQRYINDGIALLQELRALDEHKSLTELGRKMARLPIDPRFARMLLEADHEGALNEVLTIVAALSIQDPRERPFEAQQAADESHKRFQDERSDFIALLKLWSYYHEKARHLSQNKLRKLCKSEYVSFIRMREWHDIYTQLKKQCIDMGMRLNESEAEYDAIHGSLLSGLLSQVATKSDANEYTGARNIKMQIFPGSALHAKSPKWIMAAEIVETRKIYARMLARINVEWLEKRAEHLVKKSFFEPHWEKKAGYVAAFERVTLYGLLVVPRRKINYGPVNPREAREIFIRSALVELDYTSKAPFFEHNRALVADVEALEAKARRQDIMVDEETLFQFYDEIVPSHVYSARSFEKWRETLEQKNPRALFLTKEFLMRHDASAISGERFPDNMNIHGMVLALDYHFAPGEQDDGVSVLVPLAALNQLQVARFDWLVPGLLPEKITALIKSLPKAIRRNFVPVPNYAQACIDALAPGDTPLLDALAFQLKRMTGIEIDEEAWNTQALPDHLKMNYKVIDTKGKVLGMGRDLRALQQQFEKQSETVLQKVAAPQGEAVRHTRWDFGDLPATRDVHKNGLHIRTYPALVDEGDAVVMQLADSPQKAKKLTEGGLLRLVRLSLAQQVKYLEKNLPRIQEACLYYNAIGKCDALKQDIVNAAIRNIFLQDDAVITRQAEFEARLEQGRGLLVGEANELAECAANILAQYHRVNKRLKSNIPPTWLNAVADIRRQLEELVFPGFMEQIPAAWVKQIPRYLSAIEKRLEKLQFDVHKDRQLMHDITPLWDKYVTRAEKHRALGIYDPQLTRFRWLIEELRVSYYAQELKTLEPVSVKRLEEQWQKTQKE